MHGSVLLCIFGFVLVNAPDGNNQINGSDVWLLSERGRLTCPGPHNSNGAHRSSLLARLASGKWSGRLKFRGSVSGTDPSTEKPHWPKAAASAPLSLGGHYTVEGERCPPMSAPDKKTGTASPPP